MTIDAHLHLDENFDGTCIGAVKELDRQLTEAKIDKAIVLHLDYQPWTADEFSKCLAKSKKLKGFINLNPLDLNCIQKLENGIKKLGFIGLKLHPRLQCFNLENPKVKDLASAAGNLGVPVLIDAFPDGTHLMQGFSPFKYSQLALSCPKTKFVWAHFGGHYVLDFMMLAKRLENVHMDFSYSLLYYKDSSVISDIIYCMKSMKFQKIFYGSDYPDRPVIKSYQMSTEILKKHGLNEDELHKIMYLNSSNFFNL
jgi:predicted TIM-barrel fold metal-dependent hydrolase